MAAVALIIPTRNRASLLPRAIQSGLDQGTEVVVVDDASTDDTRAVVEGYGGELVKYCGLDSNRGPGYARNVGIRAATADLLVFLDDDDWLLPGAASTVESVAAAFPGLDLFFHNCRHPDGRHSIPLHVPPTEMTYAEWLEGRFDAELKPATRRSLFDTHQYEDTGAGGEGLLWGRIIRDEGAVISGRPIIAYDDVAADGRLTAPRELLRRAPQNAEIAERWLEHFGDDILAAAPQRWGQRVVAAATYRLLSGQRGRARELLGDLRREGIAPSARRALYLVSALPRRGAGLVFLLYRGPMTRVRARLRPPSGPFAPGPSRDSAT